MKMIGSVEEGQQLLLRNILSFRKNLDQQSLVEISREIDEMLAKNEARKDGNVVTITHNVTVENGQQFIDIEMMIPLDKEIVVPSGFVFLPEFLLNDAFKIRIIGSPQQMQDAVQILAEHIQNKNLKPDTPLYVVTVKEAKTQMDIDDMITDLYTGVETC